MIYFRTNSSITGTPPPALFVLDGMPIETNYSSFLNIVPSQIHSMTVLKGNSGYFLYGEDARGGVVFVETKLNHIGDEWELPDKPSGDWGDLRKILRLFRADQEFYTPPQEAVANDPEHWIRPTLYWNSEVFYNGENPVTIQYPNHKKTGTVLIIVNGVTADGMPISGMHKYEIR